MKQLSVILGLVMMMTGCFTSGTKSGSVTARAAYDMQCPEKDLQVQPLGGKSYGVRGCDKQATYTEVCAPKPGSFTGDCSWTQTGK